MPRTRADAIRQTQSPRSDSTPSPLKKRFKESQLYDSRCSSKSLWNKNCLTDRLKLLKHSYRFHSPEDCERCSSVRPCTQQGCGNVSCEAGENQPGSSEQKTPSELLYPVQDCEQQKGHCQNSGPLLQPSLRTYSHLGLDCNRRLGTLHRMVESVAFERIASSFFDQANKILPS